MNPLSQFSPISLDDLTNQAELLRRFDTKYIVALDDLDGLYSAFSHSNLILEKDGQRSTTYETTYYDSEDLHTYFDHLKQRRNRFKIRTRYYTDSSNGFLEIKMKMPRGQTKKVRWPTIISPQTTTLTPDNLLVLNEALQSSSYRELSHQYQKTLTTSFSRSTLFNPTTLERITVDRDLTAATGDATVNLGQRHAIIEIKSPNQVSQAHRLFTQRGIRPMSVSKYCVAMTALRPENRGAPWREAVRLLRGLH